MPVITTKAAGSAQGYGEFTASAPKVYIEDVFSCFLYTGNGSTQTITNGIDLSGKGGLVWVKQRNSSSQHILNSTGMSTTEHLRSNDVGYYGGVTTTFNANGFTTSVSVSPETYVSWTFRNQAKFFDVVTWTGNGSNRTISHNLGSVPGCIIVKRLGTADWQVYHRSLANTEYLVLNSTAAKATGTTRWNSTTPTSTVFSLGTDTTVNANGGTYVAYIFAHDAGGFGLSGTDNVISCGSSAGYAVNLGWEPQWLLYRSSNFTDNWQIIDNMRGAAVGVSTNNTWSNLNANTSGAETSVTGSSGNPNIRFTATGFDLGAIAGTAIYIAIRRGPMKVPTSGTSVFDPNNTSVSSGSQKITTTFPVDTVITKANQNVFEDRLRGAGRLLYSTTTGAEGSGTASDWQLDFNDGYEVNAADVGPIKPSYAFRRAPGFFDVVCYTGTGSARTVSHNLGVAPELMIVKDRAGSGAGNDWAVYCVSVGASGYLTLNTTDFAKTVAAGYTKDPWNSTTPTATVFSVKTDSSVNFSGFTYVAYLFATCPGVSKVGSYTGTGTTKQIDCGFTGGARFILIKRTDSTGDWYVYDTARGIVAGNDPYFFLNSTAAEVTNTDYVDTYSAGFELSSTAPAGLNANGGTYIFLAIA